MTTYILPAYEMASLCARRREAEERLAFVPPDQRAEERRAIRERFARLDRDLRRFALDRAGIPEENLPDRFDPARLRTPWNDAAVKRTLAADDAPGWVYLVGPSGTGKSWSASNWLRDYVERGAEPFTLWRTGEDDYEVEPPVLWLPASDLKDQLAATRDPAEKRAFIKRIATADALVLDDLWHQTSGPFVEGLRRILAERSEYSATFITSQYSPADALAAAEGKDFFKGLEAVSRRLAERSVVLRATLEPPPPESDQSADF